MSVLPNAPKNNALNRFTSLPIALEVLHNQYLTLLTSDAWEDRNDAYFLDRYREKKGLGTVLAICFSTRAETFHQWRVFSGGLSGVCIEFDRSRLLDSVRNEKLFQRNNDRFRVGEVSYHLIRDLQRKRPDLEQWPFLKRKAFKDEAEFRIIFESRTENLLSISMGFDLSAVRRVTLSPWLPRSTADSVTEVIRGIDGCANLLVTQSSLINNGDWRKAIDEAQPSSRENRRQPS